MDRNLEISLKDYLDERFSALDCKLNKLDQLRQHEHDIVISMSKDISQQYEEIKSIKLNAIQCRSNCDRRKEDFKKSVVETVTPMITSATLGVKIWAIVPALMFLLGVTAYIIKDYVMTPVRQHIEDKR